MVTCRHFSYYQGGVQVICRANYNEIKNRTHHLENPYDMSDFCLIFYYLFITLSPIEGGLGVELADDLKFEAHCANIL